MYLLKTPIAFDSTDRNYNSQSQMNQCPIDTNENKIIYNNYKSDL